MRSWTLAEQDSLTILTSRYLDGTLDALGAKQLTAMVTGDKEAGHHLLASLLTEFLLCELYRKNEEQESHELRSLVRNILTKTEEPLENHTISSSSVSESRGKEPDWDELVRLQDAERPISVIVEEFKAAQAARNSLRSRSRFLIRFAKKCFWPSRHDLEESIAPVVAGLFLVLVLLVTCGLFLVRVLTTAPDDAITTLARVNETIDAVWADPSQEYRPGQLVDESQFCLRSGLVQLEMNNGTLLVLEGPAELTFTDASSAFCPLGKVSGYVPRAGINYKIATPNGTMIDRGTEFHIDVRKEVTLLEVVQGKVDFFTSGENPFTLLANEVISYGAAILPKISESPTVSSTYISPKSFDASLGQWGVQLQAAKAKLDSQLDNNPHLVVRLDCSRRDKNQLGNCVAGRGVLEYVRVVGSERDKGPVPGSTAIGFPGKNDAIEGDFAGEFTSLTLVARVRLDRLDKTTNVLFASNDFRGVPGTVLWQVLENGTMQFHVMPKDSNQLSAYTSPIVFGKKNLHTWVTLAVVASKQERTIQFYVDGYLRGRLAWTDPIPLRLGQGTIGNFRGAASGVQKRNFQGAISEFMVFDCPLGRNELAQNLFRGTGITRPSDTNYRKATEQ